jgi:hypothetical protein
MPHIKLSTLNQNLNLYYEVHGTGEIKILFIMVLLTDGAVWYQLMVSRDDLMTSRV